MLFGCSGPNCPDCSDCPNCPDCKCPRPRNISEAEEQARETHKMVLACFIADWCGPCQKLKSETLSDPRVSNYLAQNFVVVYVDAESSDADDYDVVSFPTCLVLEGRELGRIEGYHSPLAFMAKLRRIP